MTAIPSKIVEVFTPLTINVTTLTASPLYTYAADFDDGAGQESLSTNEVSKTYSLPGVHKVVATVSDSQGSVPVCIFSVLISINTFMNPLTDKHVSEKSYH